MEENMNEVLKNTQMGEKYVYMLFSLLKKKEEILLPEKEMHFSSTEIRLLFEILSAKYEGRRLISTQLATLLGVTRSAVSQIVNHLEKRGVVKRVADDVDRKIAYIEITEEAMARYQEDLSKCQAFTSRVIDEFGEENFQTMFTLLTEFTDLLEKKKDMVRTQDK